MQDWRAWGGLMRVWLSPEELGSFTRARRYAVPRSMIEAATERRLAGDWRGACAAANVDVTFDPDDVDSEVRGQLLADLAAFTPDLLRWHLPRYQGGRDTVMPQRTIVLSSYEPDETVLYVLTQSLVDGPSRLKLCCGMPGDDGLMDWSTSRHLWDATHADELRERSGGNADRMPFFHADGTPLTDEELPDSDPGEGDQAARTEWFEVLRQRGQTAEVLAALGIEVDDEPPRLPSWYRGSQEQDVVTWVADKPLVLTRLVDEAQRLGDGECRLGIDDYRADVALNVVGDGLVLRMVGIDDADDMPVLRTPVARWLLDIGLLRTGRLTPGDLHPLVRTSMFPKYSSDSSVATAREVEPVRVRCRGEWHELRHRDGSLSGPHTEGEHLREQALKALGGKVTGCFQARQDWSEGGRLPKRLRAQRDELFARMRHGDTPAVVALLDAGMDPRACDGRKRTMLHYLHMVDYRPLLSRLLAAGLDLEAPDQGGRTPLHIAVGDWGTAELVRALIDAGARIDTVDGWDIGLRQQIKRWKREDLAFLREELERDHPDVGTSYYDEEDE